MADEPNDTTSDPVESTRVCTCVWCCERVPVEPSETAEARINAHVQACAQNPWRALVLVVRRLATSESQEDVLDAIGLAGAVLSIVDGGGMPDVVKLSETVSAWDEENKTMPRSAAFAIPLREARGVAYRMASRDLRDRPSGLGPRDHACAECCVPPWATDTVVAGFRCDFHRALDWSAEGEAE